MSYLQHTNLSALPYDSHSQKISFSFFLQSYDQHASDLCTCKLLVSELRNGSSALEEHRFALMER